VYLIKSGELYLTDWGIDFTHWKPLRAEAMVFHADNFQQAEIIANDQKAVVILQHEVFDGK